MQAAPQGVMRIDSHLSARERAERHWTAQTPENRRARRLRNRRDRIAEAQFGTVIVGALLASVTWPTWWGPGLMIAGVIVPALIGGWLDEYRPIGHRHPGSHDLAIAVRLDQGEAQ